MRAFILFLLLIPFTAFAQTTITGKIADADGKPVPYASVFLSNATVGASSAADGTFTLSNVKPGQYDLVVSFIGYQTYHQNITVNNKSIVLAAIVMQVKADQLKEVKIGVPGPNRNRYLDMFTREFLGRSENAVDCKILNPEILDLDYDKDQRTLTASTDDFLIIENKALGYKIHYQLTHFIIKYDGMIIGNYSTAYDGNVLFENLNGSPSQIKNWKAKRMETYLGSSMHFLRSIIANKLDTEGFKVLRLIRKINTGRPSDSLIRVKMAKFSPQNKEEVNTIKYNPTWYANKLSDSAKYWRAKASLPKVLEMLIKTPLSTTDFVKRIDDKNIYALSFPDYLYVAYPRKSNKLPTDLKARPLTATNYNTTVVTINTKFAIFDRNGILIDPSSTVFEGAWGHSGVADMLPVDYEPTPN